MRYLGLKKLHNEELNYLYYVVRPKSKCTDFPMDELVM